jgi:hypothetical protein
LLLLVVQLLLMLLLNVMERAVIKRSSILWTDGRQHLSAVGRFWKKNWKSFNN